MKKINSYVIKVLKNCLDFKNTKINMEFEDRVSLFIQTVSGTYFDFSKWGERRTFENLFHMIFTFDMNVVYSPKGSAGINKNEYVKIEMA